MRDIDPIISAIGATLVTELGLRDARLDELRDALAQAQQQCETLAGALEELREQQAVRDRGLTEARADLEGLAETVTGVAGSVAAIPVTELRQADTALAQRVDAALVQARAVYDAQVAEFRREAEQTRLAAVNDVQRAALDALTRAAPADGAPGEPGPPGTPGERGPTGGFEAVEDYLPGAIYNAGALVNLPPTHPRGWAVAEALEDTYDVPGDEDSAAWVPRLHHGAQGPGFRFRGAHQVGTDYAAGDVVIGDAGGAWVRVTAGLSDALPGPGWALMVKQGKTGGRGPRGEPGAPGRDGAGVAELSLEAGHLVALMTDGTVQTCEWPAPVARVDDDPAEGLPVRAFRGPWEARARYGRGDVVGYSGAAWVATEACQDVAPGRGVREWQCWTGGAP